MCHVAAYAVIALFYLSGGPIWRIVAAGVARIRISKGVFTPECPFSGVTILGSLGAITGASVEDGIIVARMCKTLSLKLAVMKIISKCSRSRPQLRPEKSAVF